MEDAVGDFAVWEPGLLVECVLCGGKRGGFHPPGPWFRHTPSHTRRIALLDATGRFRLGWFGFNRP